MGVFGEEPKLEIRDAAEVLAEPAQRGPNAEEDGAQAQQDGVPHTLAVSGEDGAGDYVSAHEG